MLIAASPDTQARKFLDPSVCILCEQSLTALQQSTRIVDTALDYWPKGHETSRLIGRKYICEGCTHHVALALGYGTPAEVLTLQATVAALQTELAESNRQLDLSGSVKSVLQSAIQEIQAQSQTQKGAKRGITA